MMRKEGEDLKRMRRKIMEEHNMQSWRKTLSTANLSKQSVIRVRAVREENSSGVLGAVRTSQTRGESRGEQRKAMTARSGTRPKRTASTQRLNPESGVFVRSGTINPKEMRLEDLRTMKIRGVKAPN